MVCRRLLSSSASLTALVRSVINFSLTSCDSCRNWRSQLCVQFSCCLPQGSDKLGKDAGWGYQPTSYTLHIALDGARWQGFCVGGARLTRPGLPEETV